MKVVAVTAAASEETTTTRPVDDDSGKGMLVDSVSPPSSSSSVSSTSSSEMTATVTEPLNDVTEKPSRLPNEISAKHPTTRQRTQTASAIAMAKCGPSISDDLWWVDGNGYDLKEFVDRHPGGKEAILLGRGRDCTALVESYHPFTKQHWKIMAKYCKVENDSAGIMMDDNSLGQVDFFYDILKERVAKVLKEKGIDPVEDRGATFVRSLYYIFNFIAFVIAGYWHIKGSILGSFLFAIFGWLMGALGHDGGHFAVSRHAWINEWAVWGMTLICNPIQWQHQHTYGHHSYTNEFDSDPDLHHFHLLLRVHKKIDHQSIFRLQSNILYVVFAYFFVVFGTCFYIPLRMISSGSLYGIVNWQDKDRLGKALGMRLHLLTYVLLIMVLPFFVHHSSWSAFAAVFVHIATMGIVFGVFSQINHLNEHALEADMETRMQQQEQNEEGKTESTEMMNAAARDPRIVNSWAATQIETSNNFATTSLVWHILSNGLNHQIEHHLFPGLNHCHLHHISPIVQQTCEEYGVQYKCYNTWTGLVAATLDWYTKLSIDENNNNDNDAAYADDMDKKRR